MTVAARSRGASLSRVAAPVHLLALGVPFLLVCVPVWPGHLGAELLTQLARMQAGEPTAAPLILGLWDPFFDRGLGTGFALAAQVACFVSGAYLLLRVAFGRLGAVAGVTLATLLPPLYGALATVGPDTWAMALLVLAAGTAARSATRSGRAALRWAAPGALALILAFDARPSDVLTVLLVAGALAAAALGGRDARRWAAAALAAVVVVGVAAGLHAVAGGGDDGRRLTERRQMLDLGRLSPRVGELSFVGATAGINLVPPSVLADRELETLEVWIPPDTAAPILTDPAGPLAGRPLDAAQRDALDAAWDDAVRRHRVAWLQVRLDTLGRSLGAERAGRQVFELGIAPNPFGYAPRFPALDDAAGDYVRAFIPDDSTLDGGLLHESWIYLLLAVGGAAALLARRSLATTVAGIAGLTALAHQVDVGLWAPEVVFGQQLVVVALGVLIAPVALRVHGSAALRPPAAAVLAAAGAVLCGASLVLDGEPAPALLRLLGVGALIAAVVLRAGGSLRPRLPDWGRRDAIAVGLMTLAGAVVRALSLGLDPRYDESSTYLFYATHPLVESTAAYPLPNNQIFHTILLHGAWEVLGERLITIRSIAFLAGVACIPAAYAAGRALYGANVGLAASALMAGSLALIDFSVNGRGYTLTSLSFLLLIVIGARLLGGRDIRLWAAWVLVAALGIYTVPVAALGMFAITAWMGIELLVRSEPRRLVELALGTFTGLVVAGFLYFETLDDTAWDLERESKTTIDLIGRVVSHPHLSPTVGTVVLLALIAAGLVLHRSVSRFAVPLTAVGFVLLPLYNEVLLNPAPPFIRSWLYVVVLMILGASAGIVTLAGRLRVPDRLLPAGAVALAAATCIPVLFTGAVIHDHRPMYGSERLVRWLGEQPGQQIVAPKIEANPIEVEMRFQGVPKSRLVTEYTPPRPGAPPPLLAVSRTFRQTLDKQLAALELPPGVTARRERTFGEVDLYALTR